MSCYIGIGNKAQKLKDIYIGVGGKARKIVKAYIGVGGKARLCYSTAAPIPTLKELLASATILWTVGRSASGTGTVKQTGVTNKYVLALFNGYASFNYVGAAGDAIKVLSRASTSYGNIGREKSGSTTIGYSSGGASLTSVYGATLVGLSFPYDDAVVDEVLSAATLTSVAGRNSKSSRTASGTVTGGLAVLATNTLFTIYDGTEKVLSTATAAGSANASGSYNLGSVYGGSILKLT